MNVETIVGDVKKVEQVIPESKEVKEEHEKKEPEKSEEKTHEQIADESKKKQDAAWRRLQQQRAEYKARAELAERQLSERQKTTQHQEPQKPTLDQFGGDVEKFTDALTDYKISQKEQTTERLESNDVTKGWNAKEKAAKAEILDYDEVVSGDEELTLHPLIFDAIISSDLGANIRYELAKDSDLKDRIMDLPPTAAVREIGKIEARIEAERTNKQKQNKNPQKSFTPIDPVKGSSVKLIDPEKETDKEYLDRRKMERIKKYGRI